MNKQNEYMLTSKTHDEMVEQWMKDPVFKAEYNVLEKDYKLLREMLHSEESENFSLE